MRPYLLQVDQIPCNSDLTFTLGSATAVLDGFALGADVVAVGAAGVAVATAPTVVGGISAAGVAAGARVAAAGASVMSAGIKLGQGGYLRGHRLRDRCLSRRRSERRLTHSCPDWCWNEQRSCCRYQ